VFFNINAIPAAGSYFYPSPSFVVCGAAQGKSRICPVLSHNSAPLSSGESAQERERFPRQPPLAHLAIILPRTKSARINAFRHPTIKLIIESAAAVAAAAELFVRQLERVQESALSCALFAVCGARISLNFARRRALSHRHIAQREDLEAIPLQWSTCHSA
jgi:hypothetical protein